MPIYLKLSKMHKIVSNKLHQALYVPKFDRRPWNLSCRGVLQKGLPFGVIVVVGYRRGFPNDGFSKKTALTKTFVVTMMEFGVCIGSCRGSVFASVGSACVDVSGIIFLVSSVFIFLANVFEVVT